ncbi:MAG: hypothetical protein BGO12_20720 [Verrucomicrobia bacterium 61-8]|nr:hypothetical protein [Verrucomicrobiota bacterium]OJV25091.1 MAG: hypothetical protein BGO12_20720 [Verrucomicrobia bacterium 61-8]
MDLSLLILAIVATVISLIFWIGYFIEWWNFLRARGWESALATIVSSRVVGGRTASGTMTGRVFPVYFDQGNPEKSVLLPREISGLLMVGVILVAASFVPAFLWMFFYLAR